MLEESLKQLVNQKKEQNVPDFLIINALKEYLQYPVLDFLYKNDQYRNFIFTGGSCLRICHDLPRLSEDLDFDLLEEDYQKLDLEVLGQRLKKIFKEKYLIELQFKSQAKKRLYLKFPILKKLDLSYGGGSDFLFVKIEPSTKQFPEAKTEIQAASNFGFNFIVKKYPLEELMTGKIVAIFKREWFQGSENEVDIKGRDFFDLFWYFQNKVSPDFKKLEKVLGIKTEAELNHQLKKRIEKKVTPAKLRHDIKNFLFDQEFAEDFCLNYQALMSGYLK